jgi:uncharacterized protein DUF4350
MSPSGRTHELTLLAGALAVMAVLAGVAFVLAPTDSSPRTVGSSFSTRSDGAKAAYLVLKQLGHRVERSYDPIASLQLNPAETLLILASPADDPSQQDVRALRSFVTAGGVVLAYGPDAAPFLPGVHAWRHALEIDEGQREFLASIPASLTANAVQISARTIPPPPLDSTYIPVFGTWREPAVVTSRWGQGRIVWCLDDTPLTNDGLSRAANVRLLANAVGTPGDRVILWDERYHGLERSMWSYLARTPLPWAGGQLALGALAVLVAAGRRRGPVRARPSEPRTSPLEFVDTMAALYERAGAERAAIEGARAQLRRRIATLAGLQRSAPDATLVNAIRWRAGFDTERIAAALHSSAELLRRGVRRPAEAVPVVAELQQLTTAAARARTAVRLDREHR